MSVTLSFRSLFSAAAVRRHVCRQLCRTTLLPVMAVPLLSCIVTPTGITAVSLLPARPALRSYRQLTNRIYLYHSPYAPYEVTDTYANDEVIDWNGTHIPIIMDNGTGHVFERNTNALIGYFQSASAAVHP